MLLVSSPPVATAAPSAMQMTFEAPIGENWPGDKNSPPVASPCAISMGDVRDLRTDPAAVGALDLAASDLSDWARSGFATLNHDPRIRFAGASEQPKVALKVDILKAYVVPITSETRTVNLVLRVHYTDIDAAVYRGAVDSLTWLSITRESASSFNEALAQILRNVDHDIVQRCAGS
jgi:hypothetical protein